LPWLTARSHGGVMSSGYRALDAKNSGIVMACPMPMSRSRLSTRPAIVTDRQEKNAAARTTATMTQHAQRIPVHADAEQGGDHHHDDGLRDRADARCECLAGHERRPRGGRDEQLGEDAGVAFPDDLDAVEDRDEQGRLRDDARCQEVQVRDRTCRYGADLAERLAEYDEPEDWLDGAGEQFTTVVPQPLQFDQAERADARDEQPHAPYRPAVSPRRGPFDE